MPVFVLIVDIDLERLDRSRRLVEREGAVAVTAMDSRDAMSLFVRREPYMTVIHVDASGEAGLGLCRDLKALRKGRVRPVVVVGPRELRSAAFEAGCYAFVTPTPEGGSLHRTLRCLLSGARKASPPAEIELIA
jgi:DNA-binding response OmpR family regulator